MSENNSLYDLLNASVVGRAIDFSNLPSLLCAIVMKLDIVEKNTQWRDTEALVGVNALQQDQRAEKEHQPQRDISVVKQEVQPGSELQEQIAFSSSPTPSAKGSEHYPEMVEALRNLGNLKESLSKLEGRVVVLEEGKVDQPQQRPSTDSLMTDDPTCQDRETTSEAASGSADSDSKASHELRGQISYLKSSVQTLEDDMKQLKAEQALSKERMNQDRETTSEAALGSADSDNKVSHELREQISYLGSSVQTLEVDMKQLKAKQALSEERTNQDRETTAEAALGSADSDNKVSHELRQQLSYLGSSVQTLEVDIKQLKAKQALSEERTTEQHLQDQLDDLRGVLENMMLPLTSQPFGDLKGKAGQDERDSQGPAQSEERLAFATSPVNLGRVLSLIVQHYEKLKETVNIFIQRQTGGRARELKDIENTEIVNNMQEAILQLQADCDKLHETNRCLQADIRKKQGHIEELKKVTEKLELATKQMTKTKADKSALESKVSRLQFDSATELLNCLFDELLNKVTSQEEDWHKVIDNLSTEMASKLNRVELDPLKKKVEDRRKTINEKLQAPGAPNINDVAGLSKQLRDSFHCLSCERPVVKHMPRPPSVILPSSPGFRQPKSIRPSVVDAQKKVRQQDRGLKLGSKQYTFEVSSSGSRGEQRVSSQSSLTQASAAAERNTGLQAAELVNSHLTVAGGSLGTALKEGTVKRNLKPPLFPPISKTRNHLA